MLPIPEGSWITGEFIQDWHFIQSGKPYVILTMNDGIVFKIVDNLIQGEGILRLYSLNPLYIPYDVVVSDIKEVWLFVHFISSEVPYSGNSDGSLKQKIQTLTKEVEKIKKKMNRRN